MSANDPGLQYPQGPEFEEGNRFGAAIKNIIDNLFFLRGRLNTIPGPVRETTKLPAVMAQPFAKLVKSTNIYANLAMPLNLLCYGTVTHYLQQAGPTEGKSFFFINLDSGTITIAGTINGNPAGLTLAQYKYAEIKDTGEEWIVVRNN